MGSDRYANVRSWIRDFGICNLQPEIRRVRDLLSAKRISLFMTQLLDGKTGLIMGVANKRSIAWGIANSANKSGARLVLTYQSERLGENVRDLAPQLNNPILAQCDVADDQ